MYVARMVPTNARLGFLGDPSQFFRGQKSCNVWQNFRKVLKWQLTIFHNCAEYGKSIAIVSITDYLAMFTPNLVKVG